MSVIILLIVSGGLVAAGFLGAFVWAVRTGQFDDTTTPPLRMLFDDATRRIEEWESADHKDNKARLTAMTLQLENASASASTSARHARRSWIPACVGMTKNWCASSSARIMHPSRPPRLHPPPPSTTLRAAASRRGQQR